MSEFTTLLLTCAMWRLLHTAIITNFFMQATVNFAILCEILPLNAMRCIHQVYFTDSAVYEYCGVKILFSNFQLCSSQNVKPQFCWFTFENELKNGSR